MSARRLVVLLGGQQAGQLLRDSRGRLSFVYEDVWRRSPDAYPLSLSLPLGAQEHPHAKVEAYLWGLLPDNDNILDRWARRFQVSARSVFSLLENVGQDCAGAVQFVLPGHLPDLEKNDRGAVEWLTVGDVAARLAALRADHAAWRAPQDAGQFSLAGAQAKTALLCQNGRWGLPSGRVPTTHILKPPSVQFDGHAENEYFCLNLARSLGLPAAKAEVQWFDDEAAIVVERYDRLWVRGQWRRVHQEDICQALGVPPTKKYQNEGGPTPADVVDLLRTYSKARDEDMNTFVGAIAFNWLIAGTDAHAKNYSVLIGAAGGVRLAPLYDVASALPYPGLDPLALKLAMKLGGHYRLRDISIHDWDKFAKACKIEPERVMQIVRTMARNAADQVRDLGVHAADAGLRHPLLKVLTGELIGRIRKCQTMVETVG